MITFQYVHYEIDDEVSKYTIVSKTIFISNLKIFQTAHNIGLYLRRRKLEY